MATGILPIDTVITDRRCAEGYKWIQDDQGNGMCFPESPPPVSGPGPCGAGYKWDPICNMCIGEYVLTGESCNFNQDPTPLPIVGDCPAGFVYSAWHNACVPDNAPTVECPLGTNWSQQYYNCVPIAGFPQPQAFDPFKSIVDGAKEWAKANPLPAAGIAAFGLWLVSGRKLKPLRRLL